MICCSWCFKLRVFNISQILSWTWNLEGWLNEQRVCEEEVNTNRKHTEIWHSLPLTLIIVVMVWIVHPTLLDLKAPSQSYIRTHIAFVTRPIRQRVLSNYVLSVCVCVFHKRLLELNQEIPQENGVRSLCLCKLSQSSGNCFRLFIFFSEEVEDLSSGAISLNHYSDAPPPFLIAYSFEENQKARCVPWCSQNKRILLVVEMYRDKAYWSASCD